jgi:hypothetical protein
MISRPSRRVIDGAGPGRAGAAGRRALMMGLLVLAVAVAGDAGEAAPGKAGDALAVPPVFHQAGELTAASTPAGVVQAVTGGLPAERAGLRAGDRLLAIDGLRIHDQCELRLYHETLPYQTVSETWTVVRDRQLLAVVISGIDASATIGVRMVDADDQPTADQLLERCGITVAADDRALLRLMPGGVVQALQDWGAQQGPHPAPAPWLAAFSALVLQALRGETAIPGDVPVPVPLLASYDAFLRAVTAGRIQGDRDPDPAALGVDRFTAALWYPYTAAPALALGTPRLGHEELARLLTALVEDPAGSQDQRKAAALQWTAFGAEGSPDRFLGQVAAALLDDERHGGWPFRSSLIYRADTRAPIVDELNRRVAANGEDADLAAYALLGPLTMNGDAQGVVNAIATLRADSPYLAWRGAQCVAGAVRMHGQQDVGKALDEANARQPLLALPPFPRIYLYCLARGRWLRDQCNMADYSLAHGRPHIFRDRPDLVAAALGPDAGAVDDQLRDASTELDTLNNLAWAVATDGCVLDPATAGAVGAEMRRLFGRRLYAGYKDTAASCFARSGDAASAARWQSAAIAEIGGRIDANERQSWTRRLAVYLGGGPFTEHPAHLLPLQENFADGGVRNEGFTQNGKSSGHWLVHRPGGGLAIDGWMQDDKPCGLWTWFAANGTLERSGWAYQGLHIGPWRTFHANGEISSSGAYLVIRGQEQRTGPWEWRWDNGKLKEAGSFLGGRRSGRWQCWTADGALASACDFASGAPVGGQWTGSANPEGTLPILLLRGDQPKPGASDF